MLCIAITDEGNHRLPKRLDKTVTFLASVNKVISCQTYLATQDCSNFGEVGAGAFYEVVHAQANTTRQGLSHPEYGYTLFSQNWLRRTLFSFVKFASVDRHITAKLQFCDGDAIFLF